MEDWSLPDNSDSSLNTINGMVGNGGHWKPSALDPLGLIHGNGNNIPAPQPPLQFTSGTMTSTDINEDIEKLFQETFTRQQLQQQQQQQQLQQEQHQRLHQQNSYQPIHSSYLEQPQQQQYQQQSQHLYSHTQPQTQLAPLHLASPSPHSNHSPLQSMPLTSDHNNLHNIPPNHSASPVLLSPKRSHSSISIDPSPTSPTLTKKHRFMDQDTMGNSLMINPATIYNIPYQPFDMPTSTMAPSTSSSSSKAMVTPTTSATTPSSISFHQLQPDQHQISSSYTATNKSSGPPIIPMSSSYSTSSLPTTFPGHISSSPTPNISQQKNQPIQERIVSIPSSTPSQSTFSSIPSQKLSSATYASPIHVPDSPPEPKPVLQPRPELRLHIKKRRPRPCVKDDKDPMKPQLDILKLRRLTMPIMNALNVTMSVDELPYVDIEQPLPTDSEQVLPPAAMQMITAMILGTSGDKDVSQTIGSQICNGDLVALQRIVLSALESRNIRIRLPSSSQPTTTESTGPGRSSQPSTTDNGNGMAKDNNDSTTSNTLFDLTSVTYRTPTNVTRLFLRLYRFILNVLLSTNDCWPFIQPVPASAEFYHKEVKYPMDLSTIEQNVWNGLYTSFAKFEQDMQLIWKNAKSYHRNIGAIPKHAENLKILFYKVVRDLKKQVRNPQGGDYNFDTSDSLPEESDFSYPPMKQVFSKRSVVYSISAISILEPKALLQKGYDKQLYVQLNGPFFQAVERMKNDPFGNHPPVPRFFIAKNRTLLRQVRAQGVLAIFYNTKTTRTGSKLYKVETDMVLTYPVSPLFDIDQTDDYAPKGWIYLRPLRVVEKMVFQVNETIERDYFKRMHATGKLLVTDDNKLTTTKANKLDTKRKLKKMVQQLLDLPAEDDDGFDDDDVNDDDQEHLHPAALYRRQQYRQPTKHKSKSSSRGRGPTKTNARTRTPTFNQENGQVSPSCMYNDDDGESMNPMGKSQKQQQDMAIKKEHQQRSTLSPDSISSAVSSQVNSLETVTPIRPVSNSKNSEMRHGVWQKLLNVCKSKGANLVNVQKKYGRLNWGSPDSEGFFKQVYFLDNVVVQTFRQMTMYQRITEVACLMKLRNLPHMAQLHEVLYNDNGDIVGLSMERYQTTLKQHTHQHSHHRLSAYQKFDIVYQMLDCMKTIHQAGLAHRDLSEVNIMVNTIDGELEDGNSKVCLYLIDFGKAVFCSAQDLREWFVDIPRGDGEYDGDVVPETIEELDSWCESLPWVRGKPDHGYRMYRSIQTLPKTRSHTQVLPWLINPQAEDIYSIGVMIWKVFTETEPWRGILDTDLHGLRYVAEDDYRIQRALEHEVHGELSRQLLLKCLRTQPLDRETAEDILHWIGQDDIREGLLNEWKMYSSETRATRKGKTMYGLDDDEDSTVSRNSATTYDKRMTKRASRRTGSDGGGGGGGADDGESASNGSRNML